MFSHTSVWVIENGNASDFFPSCLHQFSDVIMEIDVSIGSVKPIEFFFFNCTVDC